MVINVQKGEILMRLKYSDVLIVYIMNNNQLPEPEARLEGIPFYSLYHLILTIRIYV